MKLTFFKGVVLGVATCFVMLAGASALAGTGIGDVFNLGQTNSVDATSTLVGTTNGGAQLQVTNQGGGAGVRADVGSGRGVVGNHNSATGAPAGVEGNTNSADNNAAGVVGHVLPTAAGLSSAGVRGINSATNENGYGVWGSHTGFGTGVFGSSGRGGLGVLGRATGPESRGLVGTGEVGVYGLGTNIGVLGHAMSGPGVEASSTNGTALRATSQGTQAALVATNAGGGFAAVMQGVTTMEKDLYLDGGIAQIASTTGNCAAGAVAGVAEVPASAGYSAFYTAVPRSFVCASGGHTGSVLAKRVATGDYYVKFVGVISLLVSVGNVISDDNDDYLMVKDAGFDFTAPQGRVVHVRVRDAQGPYEDLPFSLLTFDFQ